MHKSTTKESNTSKNKQTTLGKMNGNTCNYDPKNVPIEKAQKSVQ